MAKMEIGDLPVSTFARFCEASGPGKVRIVRDSRLMHSDPRGYAGRDYYGDFRNTLKSTHWATNDLSIFEDSFDALVDRQKDAKKEHYRALGAAYIAYWKKHGGVEFFDIARQAVRVENLSVRVTADIGAKEHGDTLALRMSYTAPRPTRWFRQVTQHLSVQAFADNPALQPLMLDVRRENMLPPVPIPKDFQLSLEGEAASFRRIWENLDREEPDE